MRPPAGRIGRGRRCGRRAAPACCRRCPERDVRPLDAVAMRDVLHRHVQRRVRAGRAVGELAGIRLRVVDQLLPASSTARRLRTTTPNV